MTSLLIVTPDMGDNSTGRAYVWWLLAKHLGWTVRVISYKGESMWAPLRNSEFAEDCQIITRRRAPVPSVHLARTAPRYDATVTIKPLTDSLGIALNARSMRMFPLIIDIDDPDLEERMSKGNLLRKTLWRLRHFPLWIRARNPKHLAAHGSVAVSNPVLQSRYGGTLVPHARHDPGTAESTDPHPLRVAFIGTVRSHKGTDVLREAVSQLRDEQVRLLITADPPQDARPWEEWVGEGTIRQGEMHLRDSHIVALPSLPTSFAEGQLPAKLIDAMIRGRVPIVSDIEPMPWAVGDPQLCVPSGSASALAEAIRHVSQPDRLRDLSIAMRARALQLFSVDSVAPQLAKLLEEAEKKSARRRSKPTTGESDAA